MRLTPLQRRILAALRTDREQSNAQIAEAADCSEAYACRVLAKLARAKPPLASSRYVEDAEDPQTHYRMWKRVAA